MSNKEKFSIYRLNELGFSDWENRNFETIENKITEIITTWYEPIRLAVSEIWGVRIKLFHKRKQSQGILNFVLWIIPEGQRTNIGKKYESKTNHDVLFFYTENYIYWVSAWSGYKIFENYIDDEFSTDILKRSLDPAFKLAETRNITWQMHAEQQIFRWSYKFNNTESFWKVFKKLAWKLKSESVLKRYFSTDKDVNAIIQSNSVKVWTSLTIEELINLIKKLEEVKNITLTIEEVDAFKFIDSLRIVTLKERKEKLLKEFFKIKILPYLKGENEDLDIEFCSPDNIWAFFCWNKYILSKWPNIVEFEDYSLIEVLNTVREQNNFNTLSLDNAFNVRKNYYIEVDLETEWPMFPIKHKLYKCMHWEFFSDEDKYFFIIDGNVYRLSDDFRDALEIDIVNFLNSPENIITTIPFQKPTNLLTIREGDFNEQQLNVEKFLCCDRVFIWWKWWIELFDLIYEGDANIYIIHVKHGFNANTRDVCSQIEISAKHIEEDIKASPNDPKCLRQVFNTVCNYRGADTYRISLKAKFDSIGFDNFKNKFTEKNRIYVVWLITPSIINSWSISEYRSNIARSEIISTQIIFKEKHEWKFKLTFIVP